MTRMDLLKDLEQKDAAQLGQDLHRFAAELYPICRSITGEGIRRTLRVIQSRIPLQLVEVPSGTQVFDWRVPKEWNIRDACIKDRNGRRVVDFQRCNLHVLNYSTPVHATMPLSDLRSHLFTLPEHPEWIPYRTSYYQENWGFCLSHRQFQALREDRYEVYIDASLAPGFLTYAECCIRGASNDEFLIFTHVCHPSLCNDNLTGV